MNHYVEDTALLRQIADPEARDRVRRWLKRQRTEPDLVGATGAAVILKIQLPHLARLREQGRMPEPIPVDGGNPVYLREEVQELARTLQDERDQRHRRRKERDERGMVEDAGTRP